MKYGIKILLLLLSIMLLSSCGSSGDTNDIEGELSYIEELENVSENGDIDVKSTEVIEHFLCGDGEFYRLKTAECLPLKNPTWGFVGFDVPNENVYTLQVCTQEALQVLIDNLPEAGGKIIMPECTIDTVDGIDLRENVILEGAGIGKTILSNSSSSSLSLDAASAVRLHGKNNIVRNFTINGNGTSLNGVDGWRSLGNVLVEFIEAKNFKRDKGSSISFLTKVQVLDSKITIRHNTVHNALHGINIKVYGSSKMLIYSNESYGHINYGADISTSFDIEVAGNYFHDNRVAGAKSPQSSRIIYHNNDINFNDKAGLVYMRHNTIGSLTVEENDLSDNGGLALACWSGKLRYALLKNNIVTGSANSKGYNIDISGIGVVEMYGDHGKIWNENNKSILITH